MSNNVKKEFIKVDHGGIEKRFFNSVIIEKARWYYKETSNSGKLTIYFRSGIVYEFNNVKPQFAMAFLKSTDNYVGTAFNKYINNTFVISKTTKTKKFYEVMEKARKVDQQRKEKKARKQNAKLVR